MRDKSNAKKADVTLEENELDSLHSFPAETETFPRHRNRPDTAPPLGLHALLTNSYQADCLLSPRLVDLTGMPYSR